MPSVGATPPVSHLFPILFEMPIPFFVRPFSLFFEEQSSLIIFPDDTFVPPLITLYIEAMFESFPVSTSFFPSLYDEFPSCGSNSSPSFHPTIDSFSGLFEIFLFFFFPQYEFASCH